MANSFRSLVKSGFGLGIGLFLAQIVILLIGLAFFVPGYTLYTQKKQESSSSEKVVPVILMGVGVVLMGGVGLNLLLDASVDIFG